jgi:hypothetical protein
MSNGKIIRFTTIPGKNLVRITMIGNIQNAPEHHRFGIHLIPGCKN